MSQEAREAAFEGAKEGFMEFGGGVGEAVSAVETGGWTAGALALGWAIFKAVNKGLQVSKNRRIDEVAKGVKKAGK